MNVPMKNSGVDWLGEVPAHWNVFRFKQSTFSCQNGLWGADPNGVDDIECVRVADFNRPALKVNPDIPTLRAVTEKERSGRLLKRGNLLLEKSGGGENQPVGQVVLYDRDASAICSNFVAKIELAPGMDQRFWNYQHHAAYAARVNVKSIKQTSGIQNLDHHQYLDELAVFPSANEQTGIADHLDRATSRIDALVAKKSRFIDLLREKRQALITHAVTKGLDRNTAMKDSGVEWLGEVPAHWDVVQSRRLFSERNEKARVDDQQLTASQKYGLLPQAEFMEREGRRIVVVQKGHDILKRTLPGDFVISMRSFQGGLELSEYEGSVSSAYVPITPIKWVVPAYFRWAFKSITYIQALQATSDLVRDGQALRFENFTKVPLPHVPLDEQAAIADFLNRATTQIDTLIAKTERSIDLLREHRTALISAAVTGKIDLRPAA